MCASMNIGTKMNTGDATKIIFVVVEQELLVMKLSNFAFQHATIEFKFPACCLRAAYRFFLNHNLNSCSFRYQNA